MAEHHHLVSERALRLRDALSQFLCGQELVIGHRSGQARNTIHKVLSNIM
jgi:hypothetical protein